MRKSPGFAAAVIGTLALGIAAATAMFTVVDRVLLGSLPYPHASQLVEIHEGDLLKDGFWTFAPFLDVAGWRSQSHSFDRIAYYNSMNGRSFLGGPAASTQISYLQVSPNFFQTLGVSPQLGPGLPNTPENFAKSANAYTVVLSDTAWRTIFAADPNIIGKIVHINGQPYAVTGIMPRGFKFSGDDRADR